MPLNKDDKNWIKNTVKEVLVENNRKLLDVVATKYELNKLEERVNKRLDNIPTVDQFNDLRIKLLPFRYNRNSLLNC